MDENLLHHYRRFRQHQSDHGGGGAWPGEHALTAYKSARAHVFFMQRLGADLAESKRRSNAAKKAWKRRKRNAVRS